MRVGFNAAEHVKNLPDVYKKTADSNNKKILEIESIECNKLRETLQEIDNILDLNNATGKTLDLYGERVGQARGLADDGKYLLMIKAKIMRNLSNGSHESIVNAICATLNCEPSQVVLIEDDTGTVKLMSLPLETIAKSGLTTSQFISILKSMLPIGVPLSYFNLEGTFALAETEEDMEVDGNTEGLTDTEENMKIETSIGGYLGTGTGDENDDTLPI